MKNYRVELKSEMKAEKVFYVRADCEEKALLFAVEGCNNEMSFLAKFFPNLVDNETGEVEKFDWDRFLIEKDINLKTFALKQAQRNGWEHYDVRKVGDSEECIGFQVHEFFNLKNEEQAEEFYKALTELEKKFSGDVMGSENFWCALGDFSYDGEYNVNDVPECWS